MDITFVVGLVIGLADSVPLSNNPFNIKAISRHTGKPADVGKKTVKIPDEKGREFEFGGLENFL